MLELTAYFCTLYLVVPPTKRSEGCVSFQRKDWRNGSELYVTLETHTTIDFVVRRLFVCGFWFEIGPVGQVVNFLSLFSRTTELENY